MVFSLFSTLIPNITVGSVQKEALRYITFVILANKRMSTTSWFRDLTNVPKQRVMDWNGPAGPSPVEIVRGVSLCFASRAPVGIYHRHKTFEIKAKMHVRCWNW